ncbi:hypothetical protein QYE76_002552 [Lolium multiflorum]|uniref:Uncharacterized protein n=1 Tax=Lolium multiflorum TaxID=4521 RepID=A0AAD8RP51_LOLMU|nr:hypothetical protein QYE76_002552 [Lolium multiflorum]
MVELAVDAYGPVAGQGMKGASLAASRWASSAPCHRNRGDGESHGGQRPSPTLLEGGGQLPCHPRPHAHAASTCHAARRRPRIAARRHLRMPLLPPPAPTRARTGMSPLGRLSSPEKAGIDDAAPVLGQTSSVRSIGKAMVELVGGACVRTSFSTPPRTRSGPACGGTCAQTPG